MPRLSPPRFARLTTEALFKTGLAFGLALVLAVLSWWTWQDFDDERREAEVKVTAAALVVRGHAHRSISTIDAVLVSAAELVDSDGLDGLHSEIQWQRLRHIATRLPETGEAFVFDRDGHKIAATPVYPAPDIDVSDREWFRQLKENKEDLHIGHALKGRFVHDLCFPVVRALRGADGSFNGAVRSISMSATLLSSFAISSWVPVPISVSTEPAMGW